MSRPLEVVNLAKPKDLGDATTGKPSEVVKML